MPGQERNLLKTPGCEFKFGSLNEHCANSRDFFYHNHIFYVTGLLHEIACQPDPMTALSTLQFKNDDINHYELMEQRRFYDEGLRLLQTINPNLSLLTPQSFQP